MYDNDEANPDMEEQLTDDLPYDTDEEPNPPHRKKNGFADLITMQCILCIVLVLAFLLIRAVSASLADTVQQSYEKHVGSGNEYLDSLVSFAGKVYDTVAGSKPLGTGESSGGKGGESIPYEQYIATYAAPDTDAITVGLSEQELALPVMGTITSPFGEREHPITKKPDFHTGVDIEQVKGTSIKAFADGVVETADSSDTAGNYLVITHKSGITSLYMHCDKLAVKAGDTVKAGQVIATVGNTGSSTGTHLHFELQKDGVPFDPALAIDLQPS